MRHVMKKVSAERRACAERRALPPGLVLHGSSSDKRAGHTPSRGIKFPVGVSKPSVCRRRSCEEREKMMSADFETNHRISVRFPAKNRVTY